MKFVLGMALKMTLLTMATNAIGSAIEEPSKALDCVETPIASRIGSASFMHNLAQHPESIRAIAETLLKDAFSKGAIESQDCTPNCGGSETAEIIYRVSPIDFLSKGKQNDICVQLETQTKTTPFELGLKNFDTIEQLNNWIMDLSQGNGPDGQLLYQQCSSNCSPRYTFLISETGGGYNIKSQVLCGLARDKSNNSYRISTALRRLCTPPER